MKMSDLKWWHWTVATVVIAAAVRVATGGPLPFIGLLLTKPAAPAAPALPRPHHKALDGPSIRDAVQSPSIVVEHAQPELNRLTLEASVNNPGEPVALVDQSAVLIREIARALQAGVAEDSDAVMKVHVLVATQGTDRTGNHQAHLPLYALTFDSPDLFKLKPDQAKLATVLGLAKTVVFNGADAHDAMRKWCAVPANVAEAKALCHISDTSKGV